MITRFMLFLPKKMKKHLTLDKNVSAEMSDWEVVKEFAIEYETGYQYYQRLKDNPSSSAYQPARESAPLPQPHAHRDDSSRYQHDRGMTEKSLAADVPRTVKDTMSTEPDIPAVQSSIPTEPPRHDSTNDRRPRRDQNESGENGPRCYACQRLGHIRSDPICPNYSRIKERFSAMQVLDKDVVMKDTSAELGDVAQDAGSSETDSQPQSFKDVGSQHESEGSSEAFWSDNNSDSCVGKGRRTFP
ncbi:hypothetical protein PENSPDRAFT_660131 [Peniophora sp. CONT]|nr:hypothetical protein PENSPDRAFT_660131 [Peniophora sp. CONT]